MKYHILLLTGICALMLFSCKPAQQSAAEPPVQDFTHETPEAFDQRMEWWRDATFGMFIHWGAYSVPAGVYKGEEVPGIGEWIMEKAQIPVSEYEQFVAQFNPVKFDAKEWAAIAKDAGIKYIVITSKHHDGFCLWDSEVSNYDIMDASPFKRDILGELKTACDEAGIKLCFYHSIMDWHHPDAQAPFYPKYNDKNQTNPNFDRYVQTYLKPQLTELVNKYNPPVMWFDGEWITDWTHEDGLETYNYLRSLNPAMIINNRVDKGRQGMQGMNKNDLNYAGDFGTPEQEILEGTAASDWESCMTMNDTWGFKSGDNNWKSAEMLIHNLIEITAKGGNYLLNVGPTSEGLIPAPSVERLAEMGDWLDVNKEAIYATSRLNKFHEGDHTFYTRSKDGAFIYAISTAWPGNTLRLKQVRPEAGSEITMLGYEGTLSWKMEGDEVVITIPTDLQQVNNRLTKYAWTIKIKGVEV
ncbi:MAG: alpha-L-fucosidase [Bacteroidia bacterium]